MASGCAGTKTIGDETPGVEGTHRDVGPVPALDGGTTGSTDGCPAVTGPTSPFGIGPSGGQSGLPPTRLHRRVPKDDLWTAAARTLGATGGAAPHPLRVRTEPGVHAFRSEILRTWESDGVSTIGELSDIGVADLIEVLTRRQRTGRLTVKTGGQEVHLYFENGRLALVSSTDITLRLGRMLIRQGLLDTPRLLEALHAQAESGDKKSLGAILIERDWVTEFDLARCIEEQSIDALARTVGDEPGLFVFEAGARRPAHVEAAALDPETLLTAAQERVKSLNLLRDQLPADDVPLFLTPGTIELSRISDELGPPEAMVVGLLKTGAKSHAELRFQLALDELTLGVSVLTLIQSGLVVTAPATAAANGHQEHANGHRRA